MTELAMIDAISLRSSARNCSHSVTMTSAWVAADHCQRGERRHLASQQGRHLTS